jgi:predicted  nucleic acid-binding Zn-ribbon protein
MSNFQKKMAQLTKNKGTDEVEQVSLTEKLQNTLKELKEVMEQRRDKVEQLHREIADIEKENEQLQATIENLLEGF